MKLHLILWLLLFLLGGCFRSPDPLESISKSLDMDVTGGTLEYYENTHGGFHGDGETFVRIDLKDVVFELSDEWKPLPLTEDLQKAVGRTGSDWFPTSIRNGFYYFCDRHSECTDPTDDSGLLGRYSFNYTLAVYDADSGMLYYYECDT